MKSAAKLLYQTAKSCQYLKKNAKKVHFSCGNSIFYLFVVQMREIPEFRFGTNGQRGMDSVCKNANEVHKVKCFRNGVNIFMY